MLLWIPEEYQLIERIGATCFCFCFEYVMLVTIARRTARYEGGKTYAGRGTCSPVRAYRKWMGTSEDIRTGCLDVSVYICACVWCGEKGAGHLW